MAAPKLSREARRLVITRVIAGDTNNEIRYALKDAGHPHDLIDQAFSAYRRSPEVKEAIERKDSEAMQSGYAQRSERILKLAKSAKRWEKRLAISNESPDFAGGQVPLLVMAHKEYRETMKDISDLVDPVKSQRVEVTGKDGNALVINYVNDWRPSADSLAVPPSGADDGEAAG